MTFRPTVVALEAGALLRWRGRLGMPGLFDGEHELRVEGTGPETSRFTQRETFPRSPGPTDAPADRRHRHRLRRDERRTQGPRHLRVARTAGTTRVSAAPAMPPG